MGLGEKALGVQGDLIEFRQRRIVVRNDGGGQAQQVHHETHRPLENLILNRDFEAAVSFFHLGRFGLPETDEDHAFFPGPLVEQFPFAIGAHIPVEDINLPLRVHDFELDGILHGMGAAHLIAVGAFRGAGTDALDKRHCLGLMKLLGFPYDRHIQV